MIASEAGAPPGIHLRGPHRTRMGHAWHSGRDVHVRWSDRARARDPCQTGTHLGFLPLSPGQTWGPRRAEPPLPTQPRASPSPAPRKRSELQGTHRHANDFRLPGPPGGPGRPEPTPARLRRQQPVGLHGPRERAVGPSALAWRGCVAKGPRLSRPRPANEIKQNEQAPEKEGNKTNHFYWLWGSPKSQLWLAGLP